MESANVPVSIVVDRIVEHNHADPAMLIAILQDVQTEYNYLPKDALKAVATQLQVPFSRVYSVANFYKAFSLKPRGRHLVQVCLGTACHVRGGAQLSEQVSRLLSVNAGDTTEDGEFTFETVHCVGACALGPVAVVDGEYHGRMTVSQVERMLTTAGNGVRSAPSAGPNGGGRPERGG
jgi:NADH-quinone oxidoreductase subunit E